MHAIKNNNTAPISRNDDRHDRLDDCAFAKECNPCSRQTQCRSPTLSKYLLDVHPVELHLVCACTISDRQLPQPTVHLPATGWPCRLTTLAGSPSSTLGCVDPTPQLGRGRHSAESQLPSGAPPRELPNSQNHFTLRLKVVPCSWIVPIQRLAAG